MIAVLQSVPAFLPAKVSVGAPLLRHSRSKRSIPLLNWKGDGSLHKPVAFNASPCSAGYASNDYLTNCECSRSSSTLIIVKTKCPAPQLAFRKTLLLNYFIFGHVWLENSQY
jgi:hypothetical protein